MQAAAAGIVGAKMTDVAPFEEQATKTVDPYPEERIVTSAARQPE